MKPGINEIEPRTAALPIPAQPVPLPEPSRQNRRWDDIEKNTDQNQDIEQSRENVQEHPHPFFQSGHGLAAVDKKRQHQ